MLAEYIVRTVNGEDNHLPPCGYFILVLNEGGFYLLRRRASKVPFWQGKIPCGKKPRADPVPRAAVIHLRLFGVRRRSHSSLSNAQRGTTSDVDKVPKRNGGFSFVKKKAPDPKQWKVCLTRRQQYQSAECGLINKNNGALVKAIRLRNKLQLNGLIFSH